MALSDLPGQRYGRPYRNRVFTINVVVTGRCNAACTYCHYYARRDRRSVNYDISNEQFEDYLAFLKLWKAEIPGDLRYRFSGGDPMVLKDRLFDMANRAFEVTGVRPFVLTAGKALSAEWAKKARNSALSHVSVSIENPFRPDPKAPKPERVLRAMAELDSTELPIIPGVCVVYPDQYHRLYEIVDLFYEKLGRVPVIHEVNYDPYISPTEEQWAELPGQLERIFTRFSQLTPLMLFPSVSPELAFGGRDAYLFELDLENTYGIYKDNAAEVLPKVLEKLRLSNYPQFECQTTDCPWWNFCDNVKWYWLGDRFHSRKEKMEAYCRFKRILNDSFSRAHINPLHKATTCEVSWPAEIMKVE